MIFSKLLMFSNSMVLLKTAAAKHTNIKILAAVVQMHSIYSMKLLATWIMFTKRITTEHPNNKKPKIILLLNKSKLVDWCDELMPKIAYCFRTVWKIFIFCFEKLIVRIDHLLTVWFYLEVVIANFRPRL